MIGVIFYCFYFLVTGICWIVGDCGMKGLSTDILNFKYCILVCVGTWFVKENL